VVHYRKSVLTAYIIIFSALAIVLTVNKAEIPFPFLPYLKFDFAEIPVMIALLLGGFVPGLITEVIHWIGLSLARGWVLGPLMKFLAVIPMIAGFWLGIRIYRTIYSGKSIVAALALAVLFRVVVCSITNIVLFLFIAPEYIEFAGYALKATGIDVSSNFDILIWTLTLTGIFNALHVLLSSIVALALFKAAAVRLPNVAMEISDT
jgi:riboflavin transporter FmnP